jgi:hypothetical protein
VWTHPFVIGELACGHLRGPRELLALLGALPHVPVVDHGEALLFIETHHLMGQSIGWVDAHLLASSLLSRIPLWTLDRRLTAAARRLRIIVEAR